MDFRENYHESVLLTEVLSVFASDGIGQNNWYLDGTLGDGGYCLEILKKGGRIVGVDVDPDALERSRKRFLEAGIDESRFVLILGNFRDIKRLLSQTETQEIAFSGAILDLGVSSLQLAIPERGFSFANEGPLDMRMDPSLQVQALDLANGLNKGELNELFTKLGEENLAKQIADAIVRARGVKAIASTKELAELAIGVYRRFGVRSDKIHPATRVFQALRIAVNDELNALKEGLPEILDLLDKGGKLAVISFHSLEDRIVKNMFKEWEEVGRGEILTKKLIEASDQEVAKNPRSRSAKMRTFKMIS